MPRHAYVVATGAYLPTGIVTNDDLRARFDAIVPEFIQMMNEYVDRTYGIEQPATV